MSAIASQSPSSDAWDQPAYTNSHTRPAQAGLERKFQPQVVRDDWDEEDEREEEQDSAKIWEEANNKASMPELVISPSSTGQAVLPLPPAAFQPTLRILKRPSPSQSASTSSTSLASSQTRSTFAEREAQYQEARNRIFGEKSGGSPSSPGQERPGDERTTLESGKGEKITVKPSLTVVRDPLGPSSESSSQQGGGPARGFGDRRKGKKQVNEVSWSVSD